MSETLQPARWFRLEGTLAPRSWVWADGMPDWMRVADVPALVPPRALRVTLPDWPDEPGE